MSNVNPTDAGIAALESGGNYSAANPVSRARGKFQFMPETFAGVQRNNPELPKVTWEEFQQNPDAQEQYQKAFRLENETTLKRHGLPQTPANAYITHQFGAPKGIALLQADEDMGIDKFLSPEIIENNRLDPNMTVGDLRSFTNRKMDEAMGVTEQPYRLSIAGTSDIPNAGQGLTPPKNPFENPQQQKTLDALDASVAAIRKHQEGSPAFNLAVASEFKKDMGPNWQNAFISALFGQKEQAMNWITGGKIAPPQMGEAYVDGQLKRVMINSNARGDKWVTDASTGNRLPDSVQITSSAPESAIGTGQISQSVKAGLTPMVGIGGRSTNQMAKFEDFENIKTSWSSLLPTNYGALEQIENYTKKFAPALDNLSKSPIAQTILSTIQAFGKGTVDRKSLEDAALKIKVKPEDLGEFIAYITKMDVLNKNDAAMKGNHAPGSGTAGDPSFEGGSGNMQKWLSNRIHDQAMQSAYNQFFDKEKSASFSPSELNKQFVRSAEYQGVKNMQKYKEQGRSAKFVDGAPIANFNKNGELIIQKWNANTKRGE